MKTRALLLTVLTAVLSIFVFDTAFSQAPTRANLQKINARYLWESGGFGNVMYMPLDTAAGAEVGAKAYKNGIEYTKDTLRWRPTASGGTFIGDNMANKNLDLTGNRTHNGKGYFFKLDTLGYLRLMVYRNDPFLGNKYSSEFLLDSTINGFPFRFISRLRNVSNTSDSIHTQFGTNQNGAFIYNFGLNGNRSGLWEFNGNNVSPNMNIQLFDGSKQSNFVFGNTTSLLPADSLRLRLPAGTAAVKMLGLQSQTGDVYTPVAVDMGNFITALHGDVNASGPGDVAATLSSTGVVPGSYTNINAVIDAKGRILSASNGTGGIGGSQNIVDTVNKYLPLGTINSNVYYYGTPTNDSTFRTRYINGDIIYERNEGGTWITKMAISVEDDITIFDSVYFVGSTWDAFGDSYTQGVGASPSSNKYISLLETNLGMIANNVGESGTGIMDVQFKMYRDFAAFKQVNRKPTTLLIGFNDYLKSNSGSATQSMLMYAFRAAIFNHLLDTSIASNDPNLTTTGSWSTFDLSSSYPQKSKYLLSGTGRLSVASSAGDSKQYTFEGDNVGMVFFGANGTSQDYGRLKIEIDGTPVDTVTENGIADDQSVYANSTIRTEDLISAAVVYTGLSSGTHTIKATLLDNKNTNIDAFGIMAPPASSQSLVVGSLQKLLSAGYTAMNGSFPKNDAGVDATNTIIQNVVNEFRTLGYPVVYVNVNTFTNPTVDLDTDNVHWDNSGHAAGKNAFRSKIRL